MTGEPIGVLRARAREVLTINDRGGYTVPTARLYPFQWNWDSAFVAMGFATYDVDRAYRELERLVEGQWNDGMIPHIVFHARSDDYYPGPDVWGTQGRTPPGAPATTGITQPPVFATALRYVDDRAAGRGDREQRTRALYRAALRWHRWWMSARDPDGRGLVAILHNWESGSDNSPAWDDALARVPATTVNPVRRKDTGHVDAAMRPRDIDYARYIHLVEGYRAVEWQPEAMWRIAPFKVADIQSTAILARASEDLAEVARRHGTDEERREIDAMRARLSDAIMRQWSPAHARFLSRDLVSDQDIEAPSQAGFVPLAALDLPPAMAAEVTKEIARWLDAQPIPCVPSTPSTAPQFDAKRYWRGPIWAIINWYVVAGLRRNRQHALADRIETGMIDVIRRSGLAEYFDPITGEGCGGTSFSWTAAYLLLATDTKGR